MRAAVVGGGSQGWRTKTEDEISEERKLCFVGVCRAEDRLVRSRCSGSSFSSELRFALNDTVWMNIAYNSWRDYGVPESYP